MEVAVATRNPHKIEEIGAILRGLPICLRPAAELGAPEVQEDGPTLEENAAKKALAVARATGLLAFADDTGLEVAALDGAPGVISARYAGPAATYAQNNAKLLGALAHLPAGGPGRSARFRTVVVLADPAPGRGLIATATGVLEGEIALSPRGRFGFGYDPIFLVRGDPARRTLAEFPPEEKNRVSHRARAFEELRRLLAGLLR